MTLDPYLERERQRYANPIASREHIIATIKKIGKPQSADQLAKKLAIEELQQRIALDKRLRAMELEGQLVRNRRNAFGLVSNMDLRVGLVRGSKDGSGMLIPENGEDAIHLSNLQMLRVFDGDRVVASPRLRLPEGDQECVITDILQRNTQTLIGFFLRGRDVGFVEPRNKRIRHRVIVKTHQDGLANGSLVEVEITQQPGRHQQPEGRITQVLSPHETQLNEIQIALLTHNLPTSWPDEALDEVADLKDIDRNADYPNRVDLRDLALVTIDGADSRDFDDAVYCDKTPGGGFRLLVAVADVSHYVAIGGHLDSCAQHRSNSVYFPREVIPMLPERLSNDLCSLNPGVDRLAMVCEMQLSKSGVCRDFCVFQGVMRSHARLTYDEVNAWYEGSSLPRKKSNKAVLTNLANLRQCYQQLEKRREKRGALSFEIPEYTFVFADQDNGRRPQDRGPTSANRIIGIEPRYRGASHKLIEEMMVLANSCVAQLLTKYKIPTLYRVHGAPEGQKLEKFRRFLLTTLGMKLTGGAKPKPRDFSRVLAKTAEHPLGEHLFPLVLRTMQQAVYTPVNQGHYGLALDYYCHFTSPIRRYPDLLVHRGLKALLVTSRKTTHLRRVGKRPASVKFTDLYPYKLDQMRVIGLQCSVNEHKATEASNDVFSYLSCTYLSQFVGESMDGVVKSITSFGLFVSVGNTNIDGLVHISTLHNDYYHFDADSMSLVGERTHKRFSLGDRLRVQLAAVDVEQGRIDLLLEGGEQRKGRKRSPKAGKQGGRGGRSRPKSGRGKRR